MAFFDMLGVASILPFITILTNPDLIETNIILKIFTKNHLFLVLRMKNNFYS